MFAAAVVVCKVKNLNFNYTFILFIGSPQKQPAATHRGSRLQSMSSCCSHRSRCPSYFLCGARSQPQRRATKLHRNSRAGSYRTTNFPSLDRCGLRSVVVLNGMLRVLFENTHLKCTLKNQLISRCWCVVVADAVQPLTYP